MSLRLGMDASEPAGTRSVSQKGGHVLDMRSMHSLLGAFGRAMTPRAIGFGVALGSAAAACSSVHMKPPVEAGPGTEEIPIKGWPTLTGVFANEDFSIGAYDVVGVSRGVQMRERYRTLFGFHGKQTDGYAYDLKRGDHQLHGECAVEDTAGGRKASKDDAPIRLVRVGCACDDGGKQVASVAFSLPDDHGAVTEGDHEYTLHALHEVQGAPPLQNPAGYRVDGDGFIGAVDVLQPGRVWIDRGLEYTDRTRLVCAFAGLILYAPAKSD
jgi:hypothetical protein